MSSAVTSTIEAAKVSAAGRTRSAAPIVPTVGVPTAPPLPADLEALLRGLRLPHIRRHAPEVLATAKAQRWDPAEVLKALLVEEAAGRARSALATRRAAAAFPTGKTFDAWQPHASSVPAPTQQALRTLEWIGRRENLVVCGPSGTGRRSCSRPSVNEPRSKARKSSGSARTARGLGRPTPRRRQGSASSSHRPGPASGTRRG